MLSVYSPCRGPAETTESQEKANHSLPLRTQRQPGQEEKQDLNNQQPHVASGKGKPELEARLVTTAWIQVLLPMLPATETLTELSTDWDQHLLFYSTGPCAPRPTHTHMQGHQAHPGEPQLLRLFATGERGAVVRIYSDIQSFHYRRDPVSDLVRSLTLPVLTVVLSYLCLQRRPVIPHNIWEPSPVKFLGITEADSRSVPLAVKEIFGPLPPKGGPIPYWTLCVLKTVGATLEHSMWCLISANLQTSILWAQTKRLCWKPSSKLWHALNPNTSVTDDFIN